MGGSLAWWATGGVREFATQSAPPVTREPPRLVCRRDGCHRVARALAHVGRGPRRRNRGRGGTTTDATIDVDRLVVALFEQEGQSLVRLARLFVDDRNAAEDLVQEGFIRLARSAHRIKDEAKAAAYLRSIVLNLARDNNRRGLVSLRHHLPVRRAPGVDRGRDRAAGRPAAR